MIAMATPVLVRHVAAGSDRVASPLSHSQGTRPRADSALPVVQRRESILEAISKWAR